MKAGEQEASRGSKAKQQRGLCTELRKIKQQHENALCFQQVVSRGRHISSSAAAIHSGPPPLCIGGSIANADGSSYENTAFYAGCLSEEMLRHDSWLELQGGVSVQS